MTKLLFNVENKETGIRIVQIEHNKKASNKNEADYLYHVYVLEIKSKDALGNDKWEEVTAYSSYYTQYESDNRLPRIWRAIDQLAQSQDMYLQRP